MDIEMKINIFTHNYPSTLSDRKNAGIFVSDFVSEISKKNIVTVYFPDNNKNLQISDNTRLVGFRSFQTKKFAGFKFWNPIDLISFILYFFSGVYSLIPHLFTKSKIKTINVAMWAFPSGIFTYLLKVIKNEKYVVWCLGSDINVFAKNTIIGFFIKIILKNASLVFADGVVLAKDAGRLSGRDCIFLPSSSNLPSLQRPKSKFQGKIVLTYLGRLEKVKGVDIFVNSLLSNPDIFNRARVNIVGGGTLENKLKQVVQKSGYLQSVKFFGNVSDIAEISRILHSSDWLVIPSRSDSIPLVFSEAMKNRLPIISSDLPDLSYLVKKYKVGYLFRVGSGSSLANVLVGVAFNNLNREEFVKNTKIAADDFSLSKISMKFLDYLSKI